MASITNSFEGGTNGAAITQANSGGVSGTSATLVTKTGAATINFDATGKAHGSLGARIVSTGGTDSYRLRWDFTTSNLDVVSARVYFTLNSLPSQAQNIVSFNSSSGQPLNFGVLAGNTARLTSLSGTVGSTATVLSADVLYRVELQMSVGTTTADGQVAAQLYTGDSTSAIWTASSTATNTGTTQVFQLQIGENTAGRTIDITIDDIRMEDTTQSPLGPVTNNTAPTANAGSNQSVASLTTVTLSGTGSADSEGPIASYQWTQTAGTAVSLSSTTAASPTFKSPANTNGDSLTFSLTVTDGSGTTSTADQVVVTVQPHVEWLKTSSGIVPIRPA